MLKKIICDIFSEKEVNFHEGLNVIVGSNDGANSIGKTLMLLIIDFVFGGKSYIEGHTHTINKLGEHEFKYIFCFNNQNFHFIRSTSDSDMISVCDNKFNTIKKITKDEYLEFLKNKYNCEIPETTFRNIVSRYMRIYGKNNLNEMHPLESNIKSSKINSVKDLIKLFNKYHILSEKVKLIKELKENQKALNTSTNKNLIQNSVKNKTEFKNNAEEIKRLENELKDLQNSSSLSNKEIESILCKDILDLKNDRAFYTLHINSLENNLKKLHNNFKEIPKNVKNELKEFIKYFPNFNVEKIEKIENYHKMLNKSLKNYYNKAISELKTEIDFNKDKLNNIDSKLSDLISDRSDFKQITNKLINLGASLNSLKTANQLYEKRINISNQLKLNEDELKQLRNDILHDIEFDINSKLEELNKATLNDSEYFTKLKLVDNTYKFNNETDKGTGTAFKNFILLDLSILSLTCLPCICHDLPMMKNISDYDMASLIDLYNSFSKQIFIVMDKVEHYEITTMKKIINEKTVLKLSNEKKLFVKECK